MRETTRQRHAAEYLYPGSFTPEEVSVGLAEPTFEEAVANGPDEPSGRFRKDGWYAVSIVTWTERLWAAADESGEERWLRDGQPPMRRSYVVGRLVHCDDPEIAGDEHSVLRDNIRSNSRPPLEGWGVKTRLGNWQLASDFHEVVPE